MVDQESEKPLLPEGSEGIPLMNSAPQFFIPAAQPNEHEREYARLAGIAGYPVPPLGERIYSITYRHDGEEWVATVGKRLHGKKPEKRDRQGNLKKRHKPLSDPAVVLAIFPGVPYVVVTNHRIDDHVGSRWENPFYVGQPQLTILFDQDS
ncbi:hypothetical protein ACFLX5_05915 [Chloroflexota bacterium]